MSPRRVPREDGIRRIMLLLEEAKAAVTFARGRVRADLDADLVLRYALANAVENVGHEADRLSDEPRSMAPEIPWSRVTGMRHGLAHDYPNTDLDVLWDVATAEVPELHRVMEGVLERLRDQTGGV